MNFQTNRIMTFYLLNNMTTFYKYFCSKKGFYHEDGQFICFKCGFGHGSVDEVIMHICSTQIKNPIKNELILSPYTDTGPFSVKNDLCYEEFRYATFEDCMISFTMKSTCYELAENGFYYAVAPDILKCFYCKTAFEFTVVADCTVAQHKTNKKCLQQQMSFRKQLDNFSQQPLPERTSQADCLAPRATRYAAQAVSRRTNDSYSLEHILRNLCQNEIWESALDWGFDRNLVHTVIKRQLVFKKPFKDVEELIDLCSNYQRRNILYLLKTGSKKFHI